MIRSAIPSRRQNLKATPAMGASRHMGETSLAWFWATVCKTVRPMLSVRPLSCLSCLSVTFVHCGQTVGRIKMKLGMQVGLGPGHIVLDGDPAPPPPQGHSPPQFSAHFYCGQTAGCIKMPLGTDIGLRGLCVRWRPSPLPKKGAEPPNFRPMFMVAKRLDGSRCHLARR